MNGRDRDNLKDLFGRLSGPEEAARAAEEIERGDMLLDLYPAPRPDPQLLAGIKRQMAARLAQRRHIFHTAYRMAAAAAAIILVALVVLFGRKPAEQPGGISYASLIPAAVWDSDNINADDADLAYFNAEIEQIEAQMRALESPESDDIGIEALDEVETELWRMETEFWRG